MVTENVLIGGGLLERACEGVKALPLPACIKDSQLRYVCVNAAYADFHGRAVSDFADKTTQDLFGAAGNGDRDEKERRSLVFATEELTACSDQQAEHIHPMRCERFETEDGGLFLFEVFESMPSVKTDLSAAQAEVLAGGNVLDLLDVAIAVYDAQDRLIYANARLQGLYAKLDLNWRETTRLRSVIASFYDHHVASGETHGAAQAEKDAWVDAKVAESRNAYSEFTHRVRDGRWIRFINKRLDNGTLIALRIDISNSKMQENLVEQHKRETWIFREALEQLPVAVFLLDSERRLTYANAAYEMLWREPREKYYGLTESELFVHEGERFKRENVHVLETGEELQKTEEVVLNDGTAVPTLIRVGRLCTPDDERYLVGSITDTSSLMDGRRELLAARNEAERLHAEVESILQTLPVGVMLLGTDLTIEYANRCFYDLWEVKGDIDLVGQPYRHYLQLGYQSGKYEFGDMTFEDAYRDRVERLNKIDGNSSREVASKTGRYTLLSERRVAGDKFLITFADCTAIRARDREISAAKHELQRVGEYMQDATRVMAQGLALVQDGKIIMSNDALSTMFGVPPDLLATGRSWFQFFIHCAERGDFGSPEDAAAKRAKWLHNIAASKPFSSLVHVDGKRWLNIEVTMGAGNYWLVIATDITDLKQREVELEDLLARAKAADRAKSEFLANMSHEIRTPMNGVLGMAELLAKSALDTRQRTFTDVIVKSGNALLTIINDILDFSKIDAGQMVLRSTPFDAAEAVEDVASLLSSQALEKNIELIVRVDPLLKTTVSGDAGRFRQIVTNLVGNAIKFTETGHVLIDLSSEEVSDSEIVLTLRVEDTGIGIAPHQLDRIFDKFSQADTSSTRRHEGTGLGLAITLGLAGLFGGKMDVESKLGEGSVFSVALPVRVASTRLDQTVAPIATRKVSVLVIDDNVVNRQILTEQLNGWGVDSYAADSGPSGLAILEEAAAIGFDIDAVILDYHMPDMDGMEVARRLRDNPNLKELAIIFLTSMDAVNDSASPDPEFDAHLMKPVRARLLRKTLADVVQTARAKRSLQQQAEPAKQIQTQAHTQKSAPASTGKHLRGSASPSRERSGNGRLDVLIAEDNDVNQIVFT